MKTSPKEAADGAPEPGRLTLLAAASHAFAEAGLDTGRVLSAIASHATRVLADACTITLVSEDGGFIDVVAASDRDADAEQLLRDIARNEPRLRIDEGVVGEVLRTSQPYFLPVVDQDSLRAKASHAYRRYVSRYAIHSMVVVPLRTPSTVLGTLALMRRTGDPFHDDDVNLLRSIADRAALAIENARLYERAEEARKRAEEAVHARDHILAIVSHDLRNPLSAIMMAATRLVRDTADGTKQRGEVILRSAVRMQRLIGDLLDIAQIEAGGLRIDPRPYDVRTLLVQTADALRGALIEKEQELRVHACSARVRVDRERLVQALANLIGNANKFAPARTTITIDATATGTEVQICVSDAGPGVPVEMRATIFDRFVQSASGAARKLGVGLGLAIAKGIVEAHGGRISVHSVPSGGARFCLTFPAVRAAAAPGCEEVADILAVSPDEARLLLDRAMGDLGWSPGPSDGVSIMDAGPSRFAVRLSPGATYPMHRHDADEHVLIVHGALRDDDGAELCAGDRVRNVAGTQHSSTALDDGCLLVARISVSPARPTG
jgi:signal transduction histidine kinase